LPCGHRIWTWPPPAARWHRTRRSWRRIRIPHAPGQEAFGGEIENDDAAGSPTLHLERLIEEGDTVVAIGHGEMTLKEAGRVAFVSAEVFTFTGVAGGCRRLPWRPPPAPVPASGHRRFPADPEHIWTLAWTTRRHGSAKLVGVKDLTV
jgi:hypothetical protein